MMKRFKYMLTFSPMKRMKTELLMDDEENETEINSQKKSKNDNKHKENNLRYEIFLKFGTNS